jgi:hypothetical protein
VNAFKRHLHARAQLRVTAGGAAARGRADDADDHGTAILAEIGDTARGFSPPARG